MHIAVAKSLYQIKLKKIKFIILRMDINYDINE